MKDFHNYVRKNGYGLNLYQIRYWIARHEKAYETNDVNTQEWIENMFEDINYHWENKYLCQHEYEHLKNHYTLKGIKI